MAEASNTTGHGTAQRERPAAEGRAAMDRVARETKQTLRDGTDAAKEEIAETVGAARDTIDQSHDVARMGLRAAAEVQGQIADLGHDQGRRGLHTATRVADIYRETTESTAGDVHALFLAFSHFGRGVQQMQYAWFDLLEKSMDQARRRPQDLMRCGSAIEVAEAQRDLYRDGVSYMLDATTTLFDLMGRTAKQAHGSLDARER